MGLEPTTFCVLDRCSYPLSYRGSSAGWAESHIQIKAKQSFTCACCVHLPVHVCTVCMCMRGWWLQTCMYIRTCVYASVAQLVEHQTRTLKAQVRKQLSVFYCSAADECIFMLLSCTCIYTCVCVCVYIYS